jgi:branched-subunit amino acid aminotransferase/4-amino-4-deoxychorismate lyase
MSYKLSIPSQSDSITLNQKIPTLSDNRNIDILVWIGDRLYPRELARVSVLDSSVQGGDAVWEGLRIYNRKIFKFDNHLDRLIESAHTLAFKNVPSRRFIQNAVFRTLQVNGMFDGVHIRMTLTRGVKLTSSMNPVFNAFGTTLIILPEWKPSAGGPATYDNEQGISLITATNRRNPPQCLDSKIHHNNLLNNSKK